MQTLLEPLLYGYMFNAIWVATLVGAVCAFLSCFIMLKGWSLIGDALSHSVVPGVAGAFLLGLPFSLGAFAAGGLAAGSMMALSHRSHLKEDVVIGVIFTAFFGLGLFMASIRPMAIDLQTIVMGNVLAISTSDIIQLAIICLISLTLLLAKWRDLALVFFDESHARSVGINPPAIKFLFFTLLAASIVAAMMTVGAFLVIALVVTPGATAYLLSDRFSRLITLSVLIGAGTCFIGTYLSFFVNGATGGVIVTLQTALFVLAFVFAPKHGQLARRRKRGHSHA